MPMTELALKTAMGTALALSSCCISSCGVASEEGSQPDPEALVEEAPAGDTAEGSSASVGLEPGAEGEAGPGEGAAKGPAGEAAEGGKAAQGCEDVGAQEGDAPAPGDDSATRQAAPRQSITIGSAASMLAELTNSRRVQAGLPDLALDVGLCQAAQRRVEEMAAVQMLSHTRPNGKIWYSVLDQFGIDYDNAGENIAEGFDSAREVSDAFCASPEHFENVVDPSFRRLGVGMARDSRGACYWAQLFSD